MEIALGLGLFGYFLSKNKKDNEQNISNNADTKIPIYSTNYLNNYTTDMIQQDNSKLNYLISDYYVQGLKPNTNIIDRIWREENDELAQDKNINVKNLLINDIKFIKNKNSLSNIIERMDNSDNQSDSQFSDDGNSIYLPKKPLPKYKPNIKPNKSIQKRYNNNSDSDSNSDSNSDNQSNINIKMINAQDRFKQDVYSEGQISDSDEENCINNDNKYNCVTNCKNFEGPKCNNNFENQFDQLQFDHCGAPGTFNDVKGAIRVFNNDKVFTNNVNAGNGANRINANPQFQDSTFNAKDDGRYGVTKEMSHNNMLPFFKSNSYGFNPDYTKKMTEYAVRKVELFSGSDQSLQFKHRQENKPLFDPVYTKDEYVTGVPNFTDFLESRYIPSDKRQSERPFQPIMVTPGLNLGYNQIGNTGRQDLYRALPKTVDELRVVTNPKISYTTPVVPGLKYASRGVIGELAQKTPDRFYFHYVCF